MNAETNDKATTLRALHVPGNPLVLPNAWDVASARAVESAGFPVVATSSAAVAATLGYDDGEAAPVAEMLAAVARMTRVVGVPVTVDLERGYGLEPAELVDRLAATGAVGVNLEDSDPATEKMIEIAAQADFLSAIRTAATDAGVDLVINARIDAFLRGTGTSEEMLAESVERGRQYLAAGVDCVYPISAKEADAIGALVRELNGPVNVAFQPSGPSLAELAALGVARVSFGPGLHRFLQANLNKLLSAIQAGQSPYSPTP